MNAFDYFFEFSKNLKKDFLLNSRESISYNQIYSESLKLAYFIHSNFGSDNNIILISPNSYFFIVSYLAILKSGNIVVPLNPETEQNNLDFIQNKCQSKLAFSGSLILKKLQFADTKTIDENELKIVLAGEINSYELGLFTESEKLAEIIFTSGSTGEPKGVMISHKNLIANTDSIIEYLSLNENDTMLVVLPFYYCYGLSLLHTHLRVGGSIVLNNMFIMLGGVINDLKRFNCTGFAGVPSHFQILLRKSDSFKKTEFPNLRYVTQAGGKLHNVFIKEFIDTFPNIRFNVMYGQTEATARLSWLPPEMLPTKIGSCGKAIPGVQLKVIGENGKPVNPGETGEIIANGANIMSGYYKDPDSTKQTIINDWLHTGDLATIDEDGFIYLTARKKEIIKVGGRRISPKEIEEVIVSLPDVIDCSIEAVFDEMLGESMKATVVIKESTQGQITPETIKTWCGEKLAAFKVPQIVELKYQVSLTSTGKKIKKI